MADITWKPSVDEVAAYLRARTLMPGGGIAGTFNDDTNIKATEVQPLIEQAVQRVAAEIGAEPCSDELQASAKTVSAIYAAMLVEQSFFPEQTSTASNSFKSLNELFKPQLQSLANRVQRECGTGSGGADGSQGGLAQAGFDNRPLIGPNSPIRW